MRKLSFKPQAVIFDMDGVIVDSMPYHFIAWYEALRPWGVRVNSFDVYAREGEKWERSMKDFLGRDGIAPTKKTMRSIFRDREKAFHKYFKRFIFPEAETLLRCLHGKGYPLALVTGTHAKEVNKILPPSMKRLFGAIVTGDSVSQGKPHPAPYLKAAAALSISPRRCVVIENAPFGVESAKRAGMFCIAVTTSLPSLYLKKADIVISKLEEVNGFIDRSCGIKRA